MSRIRERAAAQDEDAADGLVGLAGPGPHKTHRRSATNVRKMVAVQGRRLTVVGTAQDDHIVDRPVGAVSLDLCGHGGIGIGPGHPVEATGALDQNDIGTFARDVFGEKLPIIGRDGLKACSRFSIQLFAVAAKFGAERHPELPGPANPDAADLARKRMTDRQVDRKLHDLWMRLDGADGGGEGVAGLRRAGDAEGNQFLAGGLELLDREGGLGEAEGRALESLDLGEIVEGVLVVVERRGAGGGGALDKERAGTEAGGENEAKGFRRPSKGGASETLETLGIAVLEASR